MTEPRRLIDAPDASWPAGFAETLADYSRSGPDEAARSRMLERLDAAVSSPPIIAKARGWRLPAIGGIAIVGAVAAWLGFASREPEPRPFHAPVVTAAPAVVAQPAATPEPGPAPPSAATRATPEPSVVPLPAPRTPRARVAKALDSPPPTAAGPLTELQLLIRARRMVNVAPERALALAGEHAAQFPHSAFSEEREVIAIDAERLLGRTEAAAARTRRFVKAHPQSIHRSRVDGPR